MELNLVTQLVALATIVTVVTESLKGIVDVFLDGIVVREDGVVVDVAKLDNRVNFISELSQRVIPIVIGIILSFNTYVNIFSVLGISVESLILCKVLNGFVISIGANGLYDLVKNILGYESKE